MTDEKLHALLNTPAQQRLRKLTIDLFFSKQPETEEHFQARCGAVKACREEMYAAGFIDSVEDADA